MKLYTSPKAWAIEAGHPVKMGKGRMPKNVSEEWQRLVRAGEVGVADKPTAQPKAVRVGKPANSADSGNKPKPEPKAGGVIEPAPKLWPDNTVAYAWIDGKKVKVSLRECCFNCRVSLQWCGCGSPRAIATNRSGYVPVTMEVPNG